MNLIAEIKKIREQEFKEKWNDHSNIIKFHNALEIAMFIRVGDETRTPKTEERIIRNTIIELAEAYNLKVIEKRE